MDWGWDDLAAYGGAKHGRVEAAGELEEPTPDGGSVRRVLSYAQLTLVRPATAATLEIENLAPDGELIVQAAALVDADGQVHQLLGRQQKTKYREVFRADDVAVLENTAGFPRAYLVPDYRMASSISSFDMMQRRPFQPHEEVVLAAETPPVVSPMTSGVHGVRAVPAGPGNATITRYEPERVVIEVVTGQPSFLVLSDAFYPGWRAYADGIERPVLRGNSVFRVVQVPDGTHQVVFRFQPESVRIGLAISVIALVVASAVLLAGRRSIHFAIRSVTPERRR